MAHRAAILEEREPATPATLAFIPAESAAIRLQLHRLAESPSFRTSKRCRLFLEHVIEHSLTADPEPLKERAIGMRVFGREPSYDTAADPVVRVTAGEIRRRLGQYYAEPAHQRELRVDLPTGSYTPTYTWPTDAASASAPPATTPAGAAAADAAAAALRSAPSRLARLLIAAGALAGAIILLLALTISQHPTTTFDRFWAPLVHSKVPVLLCTGSIEVYELPGSLKRAANAVAAGGTTARASADSAPGSLAPGTGERAGVRRNPAGASSTSSTPSADGVLVNPRDVSRVGAGFVSVADAVAIVRLAAIFQEHRTPYHVREKRATSFADLRSSPTVLIGMFSNAWTLQLGSEFRFVPVDHDAEGRIGIQDRQHPERTDWLLQRPWPSLTLDRDYALVSRVLDPVTGNMVVIGAGITPFGTTAAAEFLASRTRLEAALRNAPPDWPTRNLQLVLETRVIDGAAAPPKLLAMHVW